MKIFTPIRTFSLIVGLSLLPQLMFAGDGTKASPYTVSEAVAVSATQNDTIWIKADLKGLGVDGTSQQNDSEVRADSAAVITDGSKELTIWSYEILQGLGMEDLTNTKDLLIRGLFKTSDATLGRHFSVYQIHGALTLNFPLGYKGFHIQASYQMPKGVKGCNVRASYSSTSKEAKISYTYYSGDTLWISGKNTALVLIGAKGNHDFVLSAQSKPYSMTAGLAAGTKAGLNTVTQSNRYLFRFVATEEKVGFERNSDNQKEVTLDSKDEVSLIVGCSANSYWNYGTFDDGETKKWIKWKGETPDDILNGINAITTTNPTDADVIYNLQGVRLSQPQKGINIVNGKKIIVK